MNGSNVTDLTPDRESRALKLEEFLPYRLALLSAAVSRMLSQVHARHELGAGEWLMLMTLGEFGRTTAKDLGARSRMHKTKVSRAVAALLKRDLIWRQPNRVDLRQLFLELTPRGRAMYDECVPLAVNVAKRLENAISEADREAFERCLTTIAEQSEQIVADILYKRGPA